MSRNKNDKLIEDAAIRLAANAYVEKEGKKIIEEAKKVNQEKQVSDEQLAEFQKLCDREFAKQEWNNKLKHVSKVAVAAVAVIVFVSGIHQFGMTYYNPIVDEEGTTTISNSTTPYLGDKGKKFALTYIPEVFDKSEIVYQIDNIIKFTYLKDRESKITFYYQLKEENQSDEISNNDNVEIIDIDGSKAKVTRKPDENIVKVIWEKGEHIFCVEAQGVEEDEVIKVAKSVKCVNND